MPQLGSVTTHYKSQKKPQKAGQLDLVGFIIKRMQGYGERSLGLHQHSLENIGWHGGNQFRSLGLYLGMLVWVAAVARSLLPVVTDVPVMPHSVGFDNTIFTNNPKDSIHQNY